MTRSPLVRLYEDETIIDGFAGGGGASTGIELALGRPPDIAINHDKVALAMHEANHPSTRHIPSNIRHVRYQDEVPDGKRVALAWFSPDCTHHSKARGGKPFRDPLKARRIRGLAWEAVRCAKAMHAATPPGQPSRAPRLIVLENVEEWLDWCPLKNNRPDWTRRGENFRRWKRELEKAGPGYVVEWGELVACNYNDPTKRKRLFVIARSDGQPIVWPEPTNGPKADRPYRTAAECIDFSLPVPSIFLTPAQAKKWGKAHGCAAPKRPLAKATKRRIARGVYRFVINNPEPFIVKYHGERREGSDEARGQRLDEPIRTLDTSNRFGLVTPVLVGVGGRKGQSPETPVDRPYHTITAKGDTAVVQPLLAPLVMNNSEQRGDRVYSADDPIRTLTAEGCRTYQLLTPFLTPVTHPRDERVHSIEEPLRTITCSERGEFALVAPTLINTRNGERHGKHGEQAPRVIDIEQPYPTITALGSQGALVAAYLAKHNDGHAATGQKLSKPIDTVTCKDSKALVTSHLTKLRGDTKGHPTTEQAVTSPLPTISAGGSHHAEVRVTLVPRDSIDERYVDRAVQTCAFLVKYFGTGVARPITDPLGALTTKDRFGLVTVILVRIGETEWVLADIGMRMLTPRELFLCQGFPPSYEIERVLLETDLGIKVPTKLTKKEQTRLVGNSVPPGVAAAIIRANLGSRQAAPPLERVA